MSEEEHFTSTCYYANLQLSSSATPEEIKKAYRKLAVKWHPDKNRDHPHAEKYFKIISEAYQVLSDPRARKKYDLYGKASDNTSGCPRPTPDAHFHSARDIFEAVFQGQDPFMNFFGRSQLRHGRSSSTTRRSKSSFPSMMDPFDDPFFTSGFRDPFADDPFFSRGFGGHSMGGMASMMERSFGPGGFSGQCMQSSTTTFIDEHGREVTRRSTTQTGRDGQTTETTEEYVNGECVSQHTSTGRLESDTRRTRFALGGW